MSRITEKCAEIYRRGNDINAVALETGLPWHIAYVHLKNAGVLNIETRMVNGGANDRMGAFYESEFQRLVPAAKCRNDFRRQANYDFTVGGLKIEVKSSSLYTAPSGRKHWKFQVMTRKQRLRTADFYVGFGRNRNDDFKDYSIFLYPAEVLRGGNVNVGADGSGEWARYRVSPPHLTEFFDFLLKSREVE